MIVTDEDLAKALDRIARTPDGELLYRFLQRELIALIGDADPSVGALRQNFGHRKFAAKLMGLMAEGIDSVGRADDTTGDGRGRRSDRPVVYVARQPVPIKRHTSYREWAPDNDPELLARSAGDKG